MHVAVYSFYSVRLHVGTLILHGTSWREVNGTMATPPVSPQCEFESLVSLTTARLDAAVYKKTLHNLI